ncbi:MAG: UDP-N-acetylmuramoyl-L-alanine--D-glutamate ligase, partial [Actinobacteria bacterium]
NALAAAAAVHAMGLTAAQIASGLRTFAPIEHRLEPVAVVDGVEWFNDSKATNPDAVMKAVAAFEGTPLVLLLGGRNKGNDFRPLAEVAAPRCRRVVAFGEAADEVAAAFEGLGADVVRVQGLAEAVAAAREAAVDGDAVVLSPACASFDEFTSYEHRGATFKALVAALQGGEAS